MAKPSWILYSLDNTNPHLGDRDDPSPSLASTLSVFDVDVELGPCTS